MCEEEIDEQEEALYAIMDYHDAYYQDDPEYKYPSYQKLLKINVEIIKNIIDKSDIKIHQIVSRVKNTDSIFEKILRKNYLSIEEIHDICGIRIICIYRDDIDKIALLLKNALDVHHIEDKRCDNGYSLDGYHALHYIVNNNIEFDDYYLDNLKYEIQIKSILQHAWAEVAHDIIYKNNMPLDYDIQHKFIDLSSKLESLDDEFNKIISEHEKEKPPLIEYRNLYNYIKSNDLLNEISMNILNIFKKNNDGVTLELDREVDMHHCRYLSLLLSYLGINDINELNSLICYNRDIVIIFLEKIINSEYEKKYEYLPYFDENKKMLYYGVGRALRLLCDYLCLSRKDKNYARNYYVYKHSINDTLFVRNKSYVTESGLIEFFLLSDLI